MTYHHYSCIHWRRTWADLLFQWYLKMVASRDITFSVYTRHHFRDNVLKHCMILVVPLICAMLRMSWWCSWTPQPWSHQRYHHQSLPQILHSHLLMDATTAPTEQLTKQTQPSFGMTRIQVSLPCSCWSGKEMTTFCIQYKHLLLLFATADYTLTACSHAQTSCAQVAFVAQIPLCIYSKTAVCWMQALKASQRITIM